MSILHAVRIETQGNGLFGFSTDGDVAAVARVHDSNNELGDFVAWFPDHPNQWWLRRGDIAVLGGHDLAVAGYHGGDIRLHATPQAWLLGGRRGTCILMWDAPLDDLFNGVGAVDCDSPALRQRFVAALRRWEPRINLVSPEKHHAA